jgi:Ala-tRNA(Pro) deacylase
MAEEAAKCNRKSGAIFVEARRRHRYRQSRKIQGNSPQMSKSSNELMHYLAELGIKTTTIQHPPLHTVADSKALRGEISGGHTKNLFVKDKKDQFFLLTVDEDAIVDLKTIHHVIGAASKVSFGKPEALLELLGVVPGAVTVFGAVNDASSKVSVFLDTDLMKNDTINGHPLVNDATTSIGRDDLVKFLHATGHEPRILKLTA